MTVEKLKQKQVFKPSITEEHAISFLKNVKFDNVKSIGISTAGYFEGYWAELGKNVTATTLDAKGMEYTRHLLKEIKNLEIQMGSIKESITTRVQEIEESRALNIL